ncbi:MAG: serine hydrolase [Phenylobacterium sp.]|uniref:serine hydrolase domain-containing protein n=1 Tax=Phenylobacterium sp. TaxID=1871053 RepID=UPI001A4EDBE5|nr:serine hydrolase [Phenylobacterium sp.]MBL8769778.1 serine hydrolase [Phenylobacterium sp.]
MVGLVMDRRAWIGGAAAAAMAGRAWGQSGEVAAPNVLDTTPENQAATFRNQDQTRPVRAIRRGTSVRALPSHARSLEAMTFRSGGATRSVDDYMTRRRTAGLLILKRGEIALERYGMGNTPESRWTSFSTAKSMTATLAGAALHDGAIRSLDDPAERYLPALKGSAYEGVTVRNILRMCSGVAWKEDYDPSGASDVARFGRVLAEGRPGGVIELMRTLPRAAPQGTKFNYSTGETCVLGAIVAAATGRSLADLYAEKIWGPAGMEADGYWQLESRDGLELAGLGVSARLRDFGRFGQFILEDGVAGGRRVLPAGWRDLAGRPDIPATGFGKLEPGYPLGYGYQWWVLPPGGVHDGAFTAEGIFGQFIYVHPREQVVAIVWSAWRKSWEGDSEFETYDLIGAAVNALRA